MELPIVEITDPAYATPIKLAGHRKRTHSDIECFNEIQEGSALSLSEASCEEKIVLKSFRFEEDVKTLDMEIQGQLKTLQQSISKLNEKVTLNEMQIQEKIRENEQLREIVETLKERAVNQKAEPSWKNCCGQSNRCVIT